MADSKKYNGSTWEHSLRKLGTSTDTITTLPADVYADGNNATVGLVGNMYQASGVSPTTPIQPSETGERTGNLFSIDMAHDDFSYNVYHWTLSGLTPNTQYTCSSNFVQSGSQASIWFGGTSSGTNGVSEGRPKTMTTNADGEIDIYINHNQDSAYDQIVNGTVWVMLNSGSTALPYEPYGYKLTFSSANTTTNIYLGEVETTRRIKKLVLTGKENWLTSNARFYLDTITPDYLRGANNILAICSHYSSHPQVSTAMNVPDGSISFSYATAQRLYCYDTSITNVNDFKTYLQQQYAAGTPVCVWYVLATEETGIVNEPLRKIGDYADTVSGITIPTITGKDTFDVLTTLKPSEVELTYHGWHDASAKEWDGSEWQ